VNIIQGIILGIVQGLTEFLPISSTAHLRIVPAFFGWNDPGAAFTAITQLGTMAAVLHYFRRDLWGIVKGLFAGLTSVQSRSTESFRMGMYIILGTIPICIFGLVFSHQIETKARSLYLISTTLIALGLLLLFAEAKGRRKKDLSSLTLRDGMFFGLAQALALIPGVSRSGSTITAGLFLGFNREAAARYSFLLSVPAVVLSGAFELRKIGEGGAIPIGPTVVATLFAFIVGWLSIAGLLKFLNTHSTMVFVVYRVILGIVVASLTATAVIA